MISNNQNMLFIEGISALELVEAYGTPLYVYSESKISEQLKDIRENFLEKYSNTHAAYACKAFCTMYMCKLLKKEGFWLDVVSGGELYTALKAGFPVEQIEFNGNNKSEDELIMAIEKGVGRIVVDNVSELYHLERLCEKRRTKANILFRITPEVSSDTHEYITTGKKDSKFGIPLSPEILYPLISDAISSEYIDFLGFHFHVGSQLLSPHSHLSALEVVLQVILETKKRFQYDVRDFNMGGGFGIKYTDADKPLALSEFVDPLMERLEAFCLEHQLLRPHVSMEPGRFIVGEAGVQLYTIGNVKTIPDVKVYASVDGGMTDNLRPGLYGAKYDAVIANKMMHEKTHVIDISGKCCESTDILIKGLLAPFPENGDILAVLSTGAYGYAMANNYNKLPIPAVVVVKEKTATCIVRRQTYDDLMACDIG